jgi:hypothetical protein
MNFPDDLKMIHRNGSRKMEENDGSGPGYRHLLHPGIAPIKCLAGPDI